MSTDHAAPAGAMAAQPQPMREGFTTGTAATAAAMAALRLLLTGQSQNEERTPLPPPEHAPLTPPGFLPIALEGCRLLPEGVAAATVRKDGGDDPDATHKAAIVVHLRLTDTAGEIFLEGGPGVGRVTLPGLPLPVGQWAINPAPRRQIACGLRLVAKACDYSGGMHVSIRVPQGEEIARRTFNPRLGIVGGISILGTQGTVRPFSHEAWKATIEQGLSVAAATGCDTVCLSTGRRSERLLLAQYPHLPPQAAIQVADFAEFSLKAAAEHRFTHMAWGCFFGKLVKLAQGHGHTHAHSASLDFALLARWCAEAGAEVPGMDACITANHALELLLPHPAGQAALEALTRKAALVAATFAGRPVSMHLFHLNGTELVRI